MKLSRLTIEDGYLGLNSQIGEAVYGLRGSVTFTGTIGDMTIPLTPQDIEDIEQLLRNKTKKLAAEA